MRALALIVLVMLLAAALSLVTRAAPAPAPLAPAQPQKVVHPPSQRTTTTPTVHCESNPSPAMSFSREGPSAKIIQAVEQVCGSGNSQVSWLPRGAARWICIVVQEEGRYYSLDEGLTPQDFPALDAGNFAAPPEPILRTMSIYRSVAKTPLGYRAEQGDRIIVLLCPKKDWATLDLSWPQRN
ncbi:MAG TPA: hypothetical protein VGP72_20645 [Planctomycetota bacterium]|jgi:hypothetical protein